MVSTKSSVSVSAAGTASQMPGTPITAGINQKHSSTRMKPRSRVTAMAGRSRSTL